MENNYFFLTKYISNQNTEQKKNVLAIFILMQETKNSNLFAKNCTQENIKWHIQH